MADSDFSVYARIQADTSNFEKGMKNAQKSASNLSKSFGNLSKVITKALSFVGVAFGAKAIADFGKTSVQSATQATKQFKILDNTVKATGADAWTSTKQLEGLAKELSNATDYSVTELENMESVLLGFRNITDDTFSEASEAILDMATVMGMDLKSAAQTVGKALDDPIKGLDSLRRQGFQFTDEQKEELAQLVKNGEQIKAQKIILDELAQSYGGAARAGQDSFAKQRHAMENLKDELGGKLIPVLQVFAEENAKVLDALREKIEQMDFSKAVNVVTNLKNIFTKRFEEIKQRVVVAKDSIVDFLKRFNFGPVVSILDTLIGHLVETVKMFREMQGLNFGSLKEGLIELSNSEAFEKFATFLNAIIDVSHGILEEIKKVWSEIRDIIVNAIIGIWNKIKEFFEKIDGALNESGKNVHLWADLFWEELDNIYRIAQDLLKGVSHLLKGDWAVAWEYAKLAVLRVADGVLDAISTIANGMPKIINKIIDEWNRVLGWINKGLEKLNKDPIDLVPEFKSVDLSDVTGVADKIEEVENKIQELTGAAADNGISHLDKLSGRWKGFTSNALGEISALTNGVEEGAEKTSDYVTTTADKVEDKTSSIIKKISEWDSKLLQQRLENLKDYSSEYYDVQNQLIELERAKALESAKKESDIAKINAYYNKLRENENKRYYKSQIELVKSSLQKISGTIKNVLSGVLDITKNIFSNVFQVVKTGFSSVLNIASVVWNQFKEIVSINLDDTLENLLEFEDSILTFFVETLPKLPDFFSGVMQSIATLTENLLNSIDFEKVFNGLYNGVKNILGYLPSAVNHIIEILAKGVTALPEIVDNVSGLIQNFMSQVVPTVTAGVSKIVTGIGDSVLAIGEALPSVIDNVMTLIETLLEKVSTYLSSNQGKIKNILSDIITSIFENLPAVIENLLGIITEAFSILFGIVEDVIPKVMPAIQSVMETLVQNIGKLLVKGLPTIINIIFGLVDAIVSELPTIVSELVKAIPVILQSILDVLPKLLSDTVPELITAIINLVPDIVSGALEAVLVLIENLPKIVASVISGLIDVFAQTDWWKVITEIFGAFKDFAVKFFTEIDWKEIGETFVNLWKHIKEIFTPVGKWFKDTWNGAVDRIKGAFDGIGDFFTSMWKNIQKTFSGVGSWFKDIFSVAWKNIKNCFNSAKNWFKDLFGGIHDVIKNMFDGLITILKAPLNAVIKAINTVIDGLNKVGFSIPDWVPIVGGKKFGINISKLQELAVGTQNAYKGLTLVGEAGPELVNFRGGEQVLNNRNTNKALSEIGNKGSVFNVTFNNTRDTTAFAMMTLLKQYQRNLAFNGVL